jgi:hypothetical protein
VDPKALVLFGGLAAFRTDEAGPPAKMSYETFVSRAVDSAPELRREMDAVAVHPYGASPEPVLAALGGFRATLDAAGLGNAPMIADEVGWHTHGGLGLPAVPEDERADYFRSVTPSIMRSNCDVIGIAAHTWVTLEQRQNYSEDWYGMADPITGQPYPSATAYGAEVKALQGGKPVEVTAPACGESTRGDGN